MTTANVYFVTAETRAEAIEKVLRHEHDYVAMADARPVRPLTVRDARLERPVRP